MALALALALAASTDMDLLPPYPQTAQYTVHNICPLSLGGAAAVAGGDFALLHENSQKKSDLLPPLPPLFDGQQKSRPMQKRAF